MRRRFYGIIAASALLAGCGQDGVVLPEQGGGTVGECGAWYPSGLDADDGDAGIAQFGANLGETLPCFVWTSARVGAPPVQAEEDPVAYANAYLSMGEIFLKSQDTAMSELLQAQFGVSEAKIILFAVASTSCGTCPDLMQAVANSKADLLANGVIPIGVLSFDLNNEAMTDAYDLITADTQLLDDGYDETLYRANDPEHYLGERGEFDAFPYVIAVRVRDMKVAVRDYGTNWVNYDSSGFKVSDLLAAVEAFVAE